MLTAKLLGWDGMGWDGDVGGGGGGGVGGVQSSGCRLLSSSLVPLRTLMKTCSRHTYIDTKAKRSRS